MIQLPQEIKLIGGKVDAKNLSTASEYVGEFINSSMGFSPTVAVLSTWLIYKKS